MRLVGRPDLAEQPWFATGAGRAAHVEEIDDAVAAWIAERTRDEVLAAFEQAEAAIAPVYDARDIARRPAARAARLDRTGRGRRARPAQDAERDQPALRDARADPFAGGAPRRRHRRRARPSSGSSRGGARRLCASGARVNVPPLTWLYVPADRPDRVEKAIASACPRGHRRPRGRRRAGREGGGARRTARRSSAEPRGKPVYVRVNAGTRRRPRGGRRRWRSTGSSCPKVESTADSRRRAGLDDLRFHCLIESAAGLEAAYEIARHPRVHGHLARRGRPALRDRRARGRARLAPRPHRQRRRRRRPAAPAAVGLPARPRPRGARRVVPPRPRARPPRPRRDPSRPARGDRAGVPADGRRGRARPRDGRAPRAAGVGTLGERRVRRRGDARRRAADPRARRAVRLIRPRPAGGRSAQRPTRRRRSGSAPGRRASLMRIPGRTCERLVDRGREAGAAVVGDEDRLVALVGRARTESASTGAASIGKITWDSEPSSSTTITSTSIVGSDGSANAASSKSCGRMPRITSPCGWSPPGRGDLEAGERRPCRPRRSPRRGSSTATR